LLRLGLDPRVSQYPSPRLEHREVVDDGVVVLLVLLCEGGDAARELLNVMVLLVGHVASFVPTEIGMSGHALEASLAA
jgi:hypothetical protein